MTDERWVGACWMRAYWMEVSRVKYWLLIVGRVYPLIVSTSCAAAEAAASAAAKVALRAATAIAAAAAAAAAAK